MAQAQGLPGVHEDAASFSSKGTNNTCCSYTQYFISICKNLIIRLSSVSLTTVSTSLLHLFFHHDTGCLVSVAGITVSSCNCKSNLIQP